VTQKSWDAIVAGAGVIGLSLALELRKRGLAVLVVERHAPGREASHAAAGMLAWSEPFAHPALRTLGDASFHAYPEFVREVEDASGHRVDLRREGTIELLNEGDPWPTHPAVRALAPGELRKLEPSLPERRAVYVEEASVDPAALCVALERAAKHREVDLATGSPVTELLRDNDAVTGVRTERAEYRAPVVVNCCGAWALDIPGYRVPTKPMKGHMLALVGGQAVKHVVRVPKTLYLVPRSDGRLLVGSTVEDAGFDKRVDPDTVQRLHQGAANLIPALAQWKMLEAWTGLRPGTPDDLPILGATSIQGYWVATGHFRDGILLAPITARVLADRITGLWSTFDLTPFTPDRFAR
jgi:glycine oxidase